MQISHVEVFKNREFVTMVYQAIYRIDGDTLTLCFVYGPPGMRLARPTEFKTRQGQLTYLYTLKRRAR